ncbi:MAG TPA: class II fructose-bisphosphatase [Candidatus Eisenbacteria bacterium]|jgi:fructose-1,6-bisphosphatase II|nr:class II fructose-bisphosphatase [Candidatus Eisenbacteria bacterium]
MDRHVGLDLVRITESAALACSRWMGRGDKNAADQAAVTAMRRSFDNVDIRGTVVIGEGERDEAPMLYIGEQVGSGWGPEVDIALDPLECTNSVAYGRPNAMAVIALAARGHFLHAPDTYMEKIAVGPKAASAIDLSRTIEENLEAVAAAKGYHLEDLTVVILDRPRHEDLIQRVRTTGARIHLIPDGDVSAAIATSLDSTGVDVLVGVGGAPEGVLAAAALRCLGGAIQGRLLFRSDDEKARARKMGISDFGRVYRETDLASGDSITFASTGVTDGDMLDGVRFSGNTAETHSMVMRVKTGTVRTIRTQYRNTHSWDGQPPELARTEAARS